MFKDIDFNNNGSIDKKDWVKYIKALYKYLQYRILNENYSFDFFDYNNSNLRRFERLVNIKTLDKDNNYLKFDPIAYEELKENERVLEKELKELKEFNEKSYNLAIKLNAKTNDKEIKENHNFYNDVVNQIN